MKLYIKDKELDSIIKEIITEQDNGICPGILSEGEKALDKNDVKAIVKSELRDFLDMNRNDNFENRVKKIVKSTIKDKDMEKYVVDITKNVITQLYKQLYMRRGVFISGLTNSPN